MPKLTIDNQDFEVPAGKRLINAMSDEGNADQLHNCGGVGKCTSCRVAFVAGEPTKMTQVEKDLLAAKGLNTQPGVRLSCQMTCDANMSVKIISRFSTSGKANAGGRPTEEIQPTPVWVS